MNAEITIEIIASFDAMDEDLELAVTVDGNDVDAVKGEDGKWYYGISADAVLGEAAAKAARMTESLDEI